MKHFPSPIYLSPYSDCFTDQTRDLSHAFLEYLLPKGVEFWILTKGIIPTRTLNLIRKYSNQIELCVGITNLSNRRNAILENGAPTVKERLESIPKLHSTGCRVGARMDPIFPKIDDDPKDLEKILKRLSRYGIKEIAASYLFITAAQIRILKKEPFLTESLALFTEKSPTTGGNAFTLPFAEKLIRYKRMANLCSKYGIKLFVCGCKELRLQQEDGYSLACR